MEQETPNPTSSSEAASATPNDDKDGGGESSVPVADPKEVARIRSLFPLPLPQEVMTRIEHLAYMNCVHEHKRALHREMRDTEIFLTIVDTRTWNGRDYLGAHRIPPLISGVASDSDEWDSEWFDSDEEEPGMIGWGGVFAGAAAAAGGGEGGGNGNGNGNDDEEEPGMIGWGGVFAGVPRPNQQAGAGAVGNENDNGAPNLAQDPNDPPAALHDLMRMLESRLGSVPHPNQQR